MNTNRRRWTRSAAWIPTTAAAIACAASAGDKPPCDAWAAQAFNACRDQAYADYWLQRANCTNLPTSQQRIQCVQDALDELKEEKKDCHDVHVERRELCDELGGGIYDPPIDPADFVTLIDNPYFPLLPGTSYVYQKDDPDDPERVDVIVTHQTKDILGVTCTVVHAIESVEGDVFEDTFDWFAQDVHGNVWYFGELSMDLEQGELVGLGGSWKAGEDGAKPGIAMPGSPQVGDVYRQEFLIGEAEDVGRVLSLDGSASVPYGSFASCLRTEDFSPLEPDAAEHKFYAPGVGLLLELDLESGDRVELIRVEFE